MFHDIDPDALASVRGGNGVNTQKTTTKGGTEVNVKRSNMAVCLDKVAQDCVDNKDNTWMFGLLTDQKKVAQCKVDNTPVQCFDDPPQ